MMSFLAFFTVFVGGVVYLFRRDSRWDNLSYAAAEVGVVFITLTLLTGVIWAKPVWNAWWLWTPRLTTTLILWLIFVAYLMIRSYAPTQGKAALYGAIMGIFGFADVVVVYFSVNWWPGIHPTPVIGPLAESGSLNSTMRSVLLFSFLAFFVLLLYLVVERALLQDTEERIRGMRFSLRRSRGPKAPPKTS
jgi:heme exporter protein C